MPASLVTAHVQFLSLYEELAFDSTFQRSTEKGKSGPQINGDLLCSVQLAACSVQCAGVCACTTVTVAFHECALTSCNRMASTSLQQPPKGRPPDPSHAATPPSRFRLQEPDDQQVITYARSCSCPCAACCAVVALVPAPVTPWRSCRAEGGIRRQNVVA